MKPYAILLLLTASHYAFAQESAKEYSPKEVLPLNLSLEAGLRWEQNEARRVVAVKKKEDGIKLSKDEQRLYDEYLRDESLQGYWAVEGPGCSWYCGGGPESVTASSELKSQGSNTYEAHNAHDLDFKNAWAEGARGPGIGEYVTYTFNPGSPRITEIIVANGYVKSERAYSDNNRVKKLKVYLNGKPLATLNLEDSRSTQHFPFPPIGNDPEVSRLSTLPSWTLKFEIMEVYKGAKYDDTVISEIYFDGIDVH